MKGIILAVISLVTLSFVVFSCSSRTKKSTSDVEAQSINQSVPEMFYDLEFKTLDGENTVKMNSFKGKKILLVNVASKCGYTYQYEGLQKLHEEYGDQVQVIGFPCNQFLFQEPGNSDEIRDFCDKNYGVTFPLSEKIDVKGEDQHPVYTWLTSERFNKKKDYSITWNFNKFLISENGELIAYFGTKTEPMSDEIVSAIRS